MSYLSIEAKVAADAKGDLRRRIDTLERQLRKQQGGAVPVLMDTGRELHYLQRMVATIPPGDECSAMYEQRLEALRGLANQGPQPMCGDTPTSGAAAAAADCQGGGDATVSATMAATSGAAAAAAGAGCQGSGDATVSATMAATSGAAAAAAADCQGSGDATVSATMAATSGAAAADCQGSGDAMVSDTMGATSGAAAAAAAGAGCQGSGDATVSALASFMMPDEPPSYAEDQVRMLAAEGELTTMLSAYPSLSLPGSDARFMVTSWRPADSEEAESYEGQAIMAVADAAATLLSFTRVVDREVAADQERLDTVEAQCAAAREQVREGAEVLARAAGAEQGSAMTAVDVALLAIGGLSLATGIAGAGAAVGGGAAALAGVLGKAALKVGAVAAIRCGVKGLSDRQAEALAAIAGQIPRTTGAVPEEHLDAFQSAGTEATRQLLADLRDGPRWASITSARGFGLAPRSCTSRARAGGLAFSASFTAAGPAGGVFEALRQSASAGALDPGCELVWSRPLGGGGTSLRYLLFSSWAAVRDFYCVCRCAGTGAPGEFAFVVTPVDPHRGAEFGLPAPDRGVEHGTVQFGIVITALDSGSSRVEVMADLDLALGATPTSLVDREVRHHMLDVAWALVDDLEKRGIRRITG